MRFVLFIGMLMATAVGCSSNASNMPPPDTVIVTGKAMQPNGQPITGGRIRFAPAEGGKGGAESYADIKPDGTFTLQSFGGKDGTMPGTYKVSVSGKALAGLNPRYSDPASSTITIEVTKETSNIGSITFK